jgi:hypothetical protein
MLTLLFSLRDCFRSRAVLQAEILALRHQLLIFERSSRGHNLRLRWTDRALWVRLSLANCYFAFLRISVLLRFCEAQSGRSFHPLQRPRPVAPRESSVW